jgi:uncharacterized caspase-like protein
VPRRVALLVATYCYQDAGLRQLTAPGHDAEALADVLRNPEIADFDDVTILVNEPHHVVGDAIGVFYHNRRRDDLTLLYFTGHGLKDDQGRLYLAMTDTKRDRLLFTGLSAQQIDDARSPARRHKRSSCSTAVTAEPFRPVGSPKPILRCTLLRNFKARGAWCSPRPTPLSTPLKETK